jgi:putative peptidoglycan lipid II flippase
MPEDPQQERSAIARRASVVGLGTLLSRVLGLVREQVLAAAFSRAATDVFFVAFLIPNVLRQLLAEGAVQNGVLPVLAQVRERDGDAAARDFFKALRGFSWLLLCAVSLLGVLSAPWLVELFAAGFKQTPGKFERTVLITRWVFPYIVFMGTAALGVAALNTFRRFAVTAFAPAGLNVAFIIAALALPSFFATQGLDPLYALVVGVLLGGLLQVLLQWPSLKAIGYLAAPTLQLSHPAVREVLRRMAPVLFGFGVYYVDVVVARHLLSDLNEGSASYFSFAQRLCDFPQGIFVMALQSATLPTLASLAARGEHAELAKTFAHGLKLALFVAIPATLMITVLAQPLVQLLFERGEFSRQDTIETARSLLAQGAGIWAVAAIRQVSIVFFALGDTRTPVLVSAADFLVFLAVALALRGTLGHVGVAWAVSAASIAQMLLLSWALTRRLKGLGLRQVLLSSLRTLLSAVLAAGSAVLLLRLFADVRGQSPLPQALPAVLSCGCFLLVFCVAAAALRVPEFLSLSQLVLRRFRARKIQP